MDSFVDFSDIRLDEMRRLYYDGRNGKGGSLLKMDQRIIECEIAYYQCFSQTAYTPDTIRFHDPNLPDMYYHNFTYIRESADPAAIATIVEREIKARRAKKAGYLNVLSGLEVDIALLSEISPTASLSTNSFYQLNTACLAQWKVISGCDIRRVDSREMVEDVLYSDLEHDKERLGRDFCERRCLRRSEVYVQEGGVDSYNCYDKGQMVGNCDLFIHKGVAKIEDFTVIPKYQRRGYGTAILRHLVHKALDVKCDIIYLVTDEEDTPKNMYQKLGFSKIGERKDMFFDLADNKA